MFTFSISPSAGSTFVDTFSANITTSSDREFTVNWGDGSPFKSDLTHVYTQPGTYNIVADACDGQLVTTLSVGAFPEVRLEIEPISANAYAGCDYLFSVNLTCCDLDSSTQVIHFDSLSSRSYHNIPQSFYSHLVPQWFFTDSKGERIDSYTMEMSGISANGFLIGHVGSERFSYHDDLTGTPVLQVRIDAEEFCPLMASNSPTTVYQLTPLSSYRIGFLADSGTVGNDQTSAFNVLSNNNVDHIILGGDNSYDNANLASLTSALQVFTPYLSANDPEKYTLVVGNHDYDSTLSAYRVLFPTFSAYEFKNIGNGNVDLFKLDSGYNSNFVNRQVDGNTVGSKQYNNFVRALSNSHGAFKVVAFHHPAFASNTDANERPTIVREMDWNFERFGIHLVLNGHAHTTEVLEKDDVLYVNTSRIVRSMSSPTTVSPYSLFQSATKAVSVIDFYPNKFVVRIVGFDGTVLYTKEKTLTPYPLLYTRENLSGFSNVELAEYTGGFSVSATGLSPNNLFFNKITVKSAT